MISHLRCPPVSDVFRHRIRVRYGECDLQGVVFNANWLAYFDVVITELWRDRVGDYMDMIDRGVDMVVAEAGVRFRAPARFDDVVEFELRVARLGETSFSSSIDAKVDGRTVIEGAIPLPCNAGAVPCGASVITARTSCSRSSASTTDSAPAIEPNSGSTKSERQSPSRLSAGITSGASAAPETSPA